MIDINLFRCVSLMTNKPQTIFKYSDPQPHLQTMAIKEHIVPIPKIVRFKYCQNQYQTINHP